MKIIILFILTNLSYNIYTQDLSRLMSNYDIFNHPKAKGVNFSLKAPNGWDCREGDRPNIVKKFVWKTNVFLILIKNSNKYFSKTTAKNLFSNEENVKEIINNEFEGIENIELLDYKTVSIDQYPALQIVLTGYTERLGITFKYYLKQWLILYEDKLLVISGTSYSEDDFKKYESIYNLMTATIVFPDQYR
jgi:hypothetical protein